MEVCYGTQQELDGAGVDMLLVLQRRLKLSTPQNVNEPWRQLAWYPNDDAWYNLQKSKASIGLSWPRVESVDTPVFLPGTPVTVVWAPS